MASFPARRLTPSLKRSANGRPPGPVRGASSIHRSPGLASCRRSRLTSNVRPRNYQSVVRYFQWRMQIPARSGENVHENAWPRTRNLGDAHQNARVRAPSRRRTSASTGASTTSRAAEPKIASEHRGCRSYRTRKSHPVHRRAEQRQCGAVLGPRQLLRITSPSAGCPRSDRGLTPRSS